MILERSEKMPLLRGCFIPLLLTTFFLEFPSLVKATTIFPLTQIYIYISTMLLRSSPLHVALSLILIKVHSQGPKCSFNIRQQKISPTSITLVTQIIEMDTAKELVFQSSMIDLSSMPVDSMVKPTFSIHDPRHWTWKYQDEYQLLRWSRDSEVVAVLVVAAVVVAVVADVVDVDHSGKREPGNPDLTIY